MNKFDVFIDVEDGRWRESIKDIEELVLKAKDAVLEVVKSELSFLDLNKNFSVNLALSDDQSVHRLNKEFRKKDMPTNVLSFANIDDSFFKETLKQEQDIELGDVIVAFETMEREAEETGVSFSDHFCHLWVHGMLHILGFDHIKDNERIEMEKREIKILARLNIENPYRE